jgi:histone H3/H4
MVSDFGAETVPDKGTLDLPIAPVDRVARLDIDDRYRVSMDARIVLAAQLEAYAEEIAAAAAFLARHAGRRTIKSEDVEGYFELEQYFE